MKTVFKYPIEIDDDGSCEIAVPAGGKILSVGNQGHQAFAWALVDSSEKVKETLYLLVAGTGHPIKESRIGDFIGTIHLAGGQLVFHVFHAKDETNA